MTKPTDTFDISVAMMSPFEVPNFEPHSLTFTVFASWILTWRSAMGVIAEGRRHKVEGGFKR